MRILASSTIVLFASALAFPAMACDMHGGGGMFGQQLRAATWTEYQPTDDQPYTEMLEEQLSAWHKKNATAPVNTAPAKPTFSQVSSQASMAAKARLAKKTLLAGRKTKDAPQVAVGSSVSVETTQR